MTVIQYDPEEYYLTMDGHAGFREIGTDIVCAACSILMWTLVSAAEEEEFHMHLWLNEDGGSADIRCYPDEESKEKCRYLFDTIFHGMEMVAEQYPQHVKIGGSYGNE